MTSVSRPLRAHVSARALLTGVACLAVVGAVAATLAAPQSASAYPSWSEVQAAKGNAAATKTQVQQITTALDSLQKTAASRSQAAVDADAKSTAAQADLDAASAQADALDAEVAEQTKRARLAHQQAGQLAAHLYRTGNQTQLDGELLGSKDASGTLYRLGALAQLTTQWQTVLDEATVASKSVSSLEAQARVAADERDRLSVKAKAALATAQRAQQAADAEVTSASAHQQTLYAQLATLNNTSAKLEQQYRQGQAAKAAFLAQQKAAAAAAAAKAEKAAAAAAAAAAASSAGQTAAAPAQNPVASTGSGFIQPTGVVDDTAGAHSYAQSQLGVHGWGADQYQCLVLLWNQESGWRTSALNPSSGAYGIPQALPASKMSVIAFDWQTNFRTQITWGLDYIAAAYGSPCGAWSHEVAHNWY